MLLDASGLVSVLEEFRKSLEECKETLVRHDDLLEEAMREREQFRKEPRRVSRNTRKAVDSLQSVGGASTGSKLAREPKESSSERVR